MDDKHIGTSFDTWLREEGINIDEPTVEGVVQNVNYKVCKLWQEKEYYKNRSEFLSSRVDEMRKFHQQASMEDLREKIKYQDLALILCDILQIAQQSDKLPCGYSDCRGENCKDEITQNGARCMRYGLEKIIEKAKEIIND